MSLRYYTSAITLKLEAARCTGCGRCIEVCPHDVFALAPATPTCGSRRRATIIGPDRCMECGACARNCAAGAIQAGSGVGCASAIINGLLRGTEPTCDCGGGAGPSCG